MSGKLWVVVRREFVATVWRKGWLIGTLAMPLFVGLYALVVSVPLRAIEKRERQPRVLGLVDLSGLIRLPPGGEVPGPVPREVQEVVEDMGGAGPGADLARGLLGGTTFRPFPTEAEGRRALEAGDIATLFVVPADVIASGTATAWSIDTGLTLGRSGISRDALRSLLIRSLLEGRVEPEVRERILQPLDVEGFVRTREGTWEKRGLITVIRSIGIPIGFMMLLLLTLLGNAGLLVQGLSEEKENRVIEVILSSVDARSLLLGKLLGLGAAGLLQLLVWLTMAIVPLLMFAAGLALQPVLVVLCLAYFVLGFLLYGSLMAGTGMLGTNYREATQLGMVWAIGCAVPAVFLEVILSQPNGVTARVLSFIPLTSPVAMMLRLGSGQVPAWEIAASALLLAASVWLAIHLVGRIFRTALLMYGKRPSPLEVLRWLRQA